MISLEQAITEAINTSELIQQYERLTGARLRGGAPIEQMIDKSTGYDKEQWNRFFDFVRDYIWMPVIIKELKD